MKALMKAKKGEDAISLLQGLVIGLGVIGIVLAVILLILSNVRTNSTVIADNNSLAAVNQTVSAIATVPSWLPIIVIVAIGGILIALVMGFRQRAA